MLGYRAVQLPLFISPTQHVCRCVRLGVRMCSTERNNTGNDTGSDNGSVSLVSYEGTNGDVKVKLKPIKTNKRHKL